MSPLPSALSSPRGQRMMMWISGAVLVIGIAVFLGVFLSRGTTAAAGPANISSPPATDTSPSQNVTKPATVKPDPAALRVGRTFLETAVARKNLDVAYGIVGPFLKAGISRAQWLKGNNPVAYFPARNLKTAPLQIKSSTKNDIWINVGLEAAPGAKGVDANRALSFQMELQRIRGKWLVTYFLANNPAGGSLAGQGAGQGPN